MYGECKDGEKRIHSMLNDKKKVKENEITECFSNLRKCLFLYMQVRLKRDWCIFVLEFEVDDIVWYI